MDEKICDVERLHHISYENTSSIYFKKLLKFQKDQKPTSLLQLEPTSSVQMNAANHPRKFKLSVSTVTKTNYYLAESKEMLDQWMNIIQQAINTLNSPMATKIIQRIQELSREKPFDCDDIFS